MKQLPDKAEIVEQIITELGRPLRQHRSEAEAFTLVESMIKTLRDGYGRPRPDAAFIRKAAKNLRKALEPLSDATPILIKGGDRGAMQLQEFRAALDWFVDTDGPSPKFEAAKYCAALYAYRLVKAFSRMPPSTALGGQVRNIGTFLYEAFSGEENVELKRQTDAVCKSRKALPDNGYLRRFVRKEGKLREAYLDEGLAIRGARAE
ncbi:MAG TPA: hypothetical protein VIF02_13490 [Methylocella sp.]